MGRRQDDDSREPEAREQHRVCAPEEQTDISGINDEVSHQNCDRISCRHRGVAGDTPLVGHRSVLHDDRQGLIFVANPSTTLGRRKNRFLVGSRDHWSSRLFYHISIYLILFIIL